MAAMEKKKGRLEEEKVREEKKLAEVMESLKTETAGLQEEKEARESELVGLEKAVNETKSVVSGRFFPSPYSFLLLIRQFISQESY